MVQPGGPVIVAAISRWAARAHGVLADQRYRQESGIVDEFPDVERTGILRPLLPGSCNGYSHRPRQLAAEVRAAAFDLVDLVSVDGPPALLSDVTGRLADPVDAEIVFDTARALEQYRNFSGSDLT